jgi:hypothetical protein
MADLQPLASITTESGALSFYWWNAHRAVVVWAEMYGAWLLQKDLEIRRSLADILDWPESFVHGEHFMLFNNVRYNHGIELPEKLATWFLQCQWSDYACDRRPVSVHVTKKAPAPPTHSAVSPPAIFPPFRASRWSDAEEEKESDDEFIPVQPPMPRGFLWK